MGGAHSLNRAVNYKSEDDPIMAGEKFLQGQIRSNLLVTRWFIVLSICSR